MDNALAKCRKQRGLTQKQLADMAGVAQSYVSDLESGVCTLSRLSLDVAVRLAAALGIHAEELLE
jgi:transcriptional regulator with XRE-family HTH domain